MDNAKRTEKVIKLERNVKSFLDRQAGPDLAFWNAQLGYDGPEDYKIRTQPPRPAAPAVTSETGENDADAAEAAEGHHGILSLKPSPSDCPCILAAKKTAALTLPPPPSVTSWSQFCQCDAPPSSPPEETAKTDQQRKVSGASSTSTKGPAGSDRRSSDRSSIQGRRLSDKSTASQPGNRLSDKIRAQEQRRSDAEKAKASEMERRFSYKIAQQKKKLPPVPGLDLSKYSEAGVDVMIRPVKGPRTDKKTKLADPVDLTLLPQGIKKEELLSRGGRRDTILILRPPAEPEKLNPPLENPEEPAKVVEVREAPLDLVIQFMEAVIQKKYALALKDAHAILKLEPQNELVQAYCPVLQELIELENSDSDSSWTTDSEDESSGSENISEVSSASSASESLAESSDDDSSELSTATVSSASSVMTDEYDSEYAIESGDGDGDETGYETGMTSDTQAPNSMASPALPPTPAPTPASAAPPTAPTRRSRSLAKQKKKNSTSKSNK